TMSQWRTQSDVITGFATIDKYFLFTKKHVVYIFDNNIGAQVELTKMTFAKFFQVIDDMPQGEGSKIFGFSRKWVFMAIIIACFILFIVLITVIICCHCRKK